MMNKLIQRKQQDGAALVVGLILLVVITVLAISGMNTATTGLAMARNDQNYENAFQAAETGLERALSQGSFIAMGVVLPVALAERVRLIVIADPNRQRIPRHRRRPCIPLASDKAQLRHALGLTEVQCNAALSVVESAAAPSPRELLDGSGGGVRVEVQNTDPRPQSSARLP